MNTKEWRKYLLNLNLSAGDKSAFILCDSILKKERGIINNFCHKKYGLGWGEIESNTKLLNVLMELKITNQIKWRTPVWFEKYLKYLQLI